MVFRLLIDSEVLEKLSRMPEGQRRAVYEHLGKIQRYPGHYSDYIRPDAEGRRLDVSIFRRFCIVYWTDAADRHVKILDLEENE